jgi:hypothetical protein
MRKLGNVNIIRVITKTVSDLLFFRARLDLMVVIIAIKAQTVGLSVISDLLFRGVRSGYLKVSAGLLEVLIVLTLIARIKLHRIIISGGVRGCLGLLRLRDLVREIGLVLELRILVVAGLVSTVPALKLYALPALNLYALQICRSQICRFKIYSSQALKAPIASYG